MKKKFFIFIFLLIVIFVLAGFTFGEMSHKYKYDIIVYDATQKEIIIDNYFSTEEKFYKDSLEKLLEEKITNFNEYTITDIQFNGCCTTFGDNEEFDNYEYEDGSRNQIFVHIAKDPRIYTYIVNCVFGDESIHHSIRTYCDLNDLTYLNSIARSVQLENGNASKYNFDDYYISEFYFNGAVVKNAMFSYHEPDEYLLTLFFEPRFESYNSEDNSSDGELEAMIQVNDTKEEIISEGVIVSSENPNYEFFTDDKATLEMIICIDILMVFLLILTIYLVRKFKNKVLDFPSDNYYYDEEEEKKEQ